MDLIFFLKVPPNFSPLPGFGKNCPKRPEASGKIKNLNSIKFAKNGDGAKRKRYPSFLVVGENFLKLVSMDAQLNSPLGNKTFFGS